jgi:hypothetical protein
MVGQMLNPGIGLTVIDLGFPKKRGGSYVYCFLFSLGRNYPHFSPYL